MKIRLFQATICTISVQGRWILSRGMLDFQGVIDYSRGGIYMLYRHSHVWWVLSICCDRWFTMLDSWHSSNDLRDPGCAHLITRVSPARDMGGGGNVHKCPVMWLASFFYWTFFSLDITVRDTFLDITGHCHKKYSTFCLTLVPWWAMILLNVQLAKLVIYTTESELSLSQKIRIYMLWLASLFLLDIFFHWTLLDITGHLTLCVRCSEQTTRTKFWRGKYL